MTTKIDLYKRLMQPTPDARPGSLQLLAETLVGWEQMLREMVAMFNTRHDGPEDECGTWCEMMAMYIDVVIEARKAIAAAVATYVCYLHDTGVSTEVELDLVNRTAVSMTAQAVEARISRLAGTPDDEDEETEIESSSDKLN